MKILIFNSLYYPHIIGGAEKSVQKLAEGLLKEGYIPVIVSTAPKDSINYINGIKVYYLNNRNIYWFSAFDNPNLFKKFFWHLIDIRNVFLKEKLKEIFSQEKPDVVHTNNLAGFSVIVWEIAKNLNLPVVHTLRDYYLLCPSSTMFKGNKPCVNQCFNCKIFSLLKKNYSNKYVDAVVGISHFILKKHLNFNYFINTKTQVVIYNPVDISSIPQVKPGNRKDIVLGYIGRLSPEKGIEFLLANFTKMNLKNVKLFIFGKATNPQYENYLKSKYKSKNIVFKGFKKAHEIYSQIDITVIPSLWHEPFSRVLAESYSYGVPVLASKRGGIPENVIEGKTGLLFEPDKDKDFQIKLSYMLKILDKFSPQEIKRISLKFSQEKIISQYKVLYERILKG